ncbi:hypothetical protein EBU95_09625 [bacterium]|nr:hypothetical protein [bacterium]
MKVKGKIIPLRNNIIVSDMDFDHQVTKSGLFVASDNGKTSGIHPRWGKVFAVGPDQQDLNIGDWVLVEHGRWTRTIEWEDDIGDIKELRMVEEKSVLAVSEEKPSDIMRS